MMPVFVQFLLSALLSSSALANGGVTTIGDGGLVAICPFTTSKADVRLYFFDLLEAQKTGTPYRTTFGDVSLGLPKKVAIGMERIKGRLQLTDDDLRAARQVAAVLMQLQFDPTKLYPYANQHDFVFKVHSVRTSPRVYHFLKKRRCQLNVAIARFTRAQITSPEIRDLCSRSPGGIDLCFLTNRDIYFRLTQDERACLILHESLRYLPESKKPRSENELRSLAAQICTQ